MNLFNFEQHRIELETYQKSILTEKAKEYAAVDLDPKSTLDRLISFKEGGKLEERNPEEYLRSLQTKHILSVKKLMKDLVNGKVAPFEMWREKLMDINTYNILLLALIKERIEKSDNE